MISRNPAAEGNSHHRFRCHFGSSLCVVWSPARSSTRRPSAWFPPFLSVPFCFSGNDPPFLLAARRWRRRGQRDFGDDGSCVGRRLSLRGLELSAVASSRWREEEDFKAGHPSLGFNGSRPARPCCSGGRATAGPPPCLGWPDQCGDHPEPDATCVFRTGTSPSGCAG